MNPANVRCGLALTAALFISACGTGVKENETSAVQQSLAGSGRVWVAYDSGTINGSTISSYFQCLLHNTNFNNLIAAYSNGFTMSWGGIAQINHCGVYHCGTAGDQATVQCVVNNAKFPVAYGDLVVYYPASALSGNGCNGWSGPGCSDARNNSNFITVNNTSVTYAFSFSGTSQSCQTAFGLHEVYEAATDGVSADCCNGQGGCSVSNYGWYTLNMCGGSYTGQKVSPTGHEWDASYCTTLSVCAGPECGGRCCPSGAWCGSSGQCCTGCGTGCPC